MVDVKQTFLTEQIKVVFRVVVLVGLCYVRRLSEYMTKSSELQNLGLDDVNVHCVGPQSHNCIWDNKHLNAVSLHLGENDLGHMPDGQISCELLQLVDHLSTLSHSLIVIVD